MTTPTKYEGIASLCMILFFLAAGTSVYFYREARDLQKNPQKIAQKETEDIIARVHKLIVLPEGETPTLAIVSDPERLKD